jgi:hypothetical protein
MRSADFLALASSYVTAINRGAVPTITDAWTEIIEGQARQAIVKAVKHYQKEVKSYIQMNSGDQGQRLMVDLNELKAFNKKLRGQTMDILEKVLAKNPKIVSPSSQEKLRALLEGQVSDVWEGVKGKILAEQERQARDTMAELYRERILQKSYGAEDL